MGQDSYDPTTSVSGDPSGGIDNSGSGDWLSDWGEFIFEGALAIGSGLFSYEANRKKYKAQRKALKEQINLYGQQREDLSEAFELRKRLLDKSTAQREDEAKGLFKIKTKEFQLEGGNINRGEENAAAKTGLAYSGTVEDLGDRKREGFQLGVDEAGESFQSSLAQLKDNLAQLQLKNTTERDKTLSDIDITIHGLKAERKAIGKKQVGFFESLF